MVEAPKKMVRWASTIKLPIGEDQEKKEKKDDDNNNSTSIEMEETGAATRTIPAAQRNSFGQSFCDQGFAKKKSTTFQLPASICRASTFLFPGETLLMIKPSISALALRLALDLAVSLSGMSQHFGQQILKN